MRLSIVPIALAIIALLLIMSPVYATLIDDGLYTTDTRTKVSRLDVIPTQGQARIERFRPGNGFRLLVFCGLQ